MAERNSKKIQDQKKKSRKGTLELQFGPDPKFYWGFTQPFSVSNYTFGLPLIPKSLIKSTLVPYFIGLCPPIPANSRPVVLLEQCLARQEYFNVMEHLQPAMFMTDRVRVSQNSLLFWPGQRQFSAVCLGNHGSAQKSCQSLFWLANTIVHKSKDSVCIYLSTFVLTYILCCTCHTICMYQIFQNFKNEFSSLSLLDPLLYHFNKQN